MAEIKVEVVPVRLGKHPDADNLSIATVKGWQCVVRTKDFVDPAIDRDIKLGAYIPIGSVLPATEEWEFLKLRNYHVKTMRLRGYVSQGLLIPARDGWVQGEDVTKLLGVTKYEPPIPADMVGVYMSDPAGFYSYTEIQHFNDFPGIFTPDDVVIVTEKIHGINARFAILDGVFYVGSHQMCIDPQCAATNVYWKAAKLHEIERKLRSAYLGSNIMMYAEIYGLGVQNLSYGRKDGLGVVVLDIMEPHGMRFLPEAHVNKFCREHGMESAPVLYRGRYNSLVLRHHVGQSQLDEHTVREGIVIKSENRTNHPQIGRKILKLLSEEFLMMSDGTEFH